MADRRRRREPVDSKEDAEKIVTDKHLIRKSECESEHGDVDGDVDLSEYESADEEKKDEDEESEEDSDEETDDDDDDDDDDETDDDDGQDINVVIEGDDDDWVDEERQSGDGEEQPDSKDVDDDEDRKNPAFVPRKGAFYEHDSREKDSKPPKEEEEGDRSNSKKRLWKDDGKWLHDGYNEAQQAPKTQEELIAIYGYDVRAGSQPPEYRPRPRRGGGRGRRPGENTRFGDYIQTDKIEDRETSSQFRRSHSEETEYIPMEYRTPPSFRNDDNRSKSDYKPRNKPYNNRSKNRSFETDNRQREDNYQYDSRAKGDNYQYDNFSKGGNYQSENRSRGERSDYRSRDNKAYNDYNKSTTDYRNNASNRGYSTDNYSKSSDYRQNTGYHSQDYEHHESDSYQNRGQNKAQRGRGRGQKRYQDSENESRNFAPGSQNNSPRQFTNSNYRAPEKTDKTRFENNEPADIQQTKEDVVISNKENVQTISVTITNTTTEKKSYSKDRRMKYVGGRPRQQDEPSNFVACQGGGSLKCEVPDTGTQPTQTSTPETSQSSTKPSKNPPSSTGTTKADNSLQTRPKRYSSQRQRPGPDVGYNKQIEGSNYYNQGYPNTQFYSGSDHPQSPSQDSPTFQPILQPSGITTYPLPVSSSNMPTAPRLYPPSPAPIASTVPIPSTLPPAPHAQIIPPQYLGQGTVIYGAAPPGITPAPPFSVPMGFAGGTPPQPIQSPPSQQPEVYRGGTIYYPPELQPANPHRSPVRRLKSAIPIVNPQEIKQGSRRQPELLESDEPLEGHQQYIQQEGNYDPSSADADDTDDVRQELKEITSALVNLEGELRAGSTKIRQKEEDMKTRDLQQKLDSYLQSVDTSDSHVSNTSDTDVTNIKTVSSVVDRLEKTVCVSETAVTGAVTGAGKRDSITFKKESLIQNLEMGEMRSEKIPERSKIKVKTEDEDADSVKTEISVDNIKSEVPGLEIPTSKTEINLEKELAVSQTKTEQIIKTEAVVTTDGTVHHSEAELEETVHAKIKTTADYIQNKSEVVEDNTNLDAISQTITETDCKTSEITEHANKL